MAEGRCCALRFFTAGRITGVDGQEPSSNPIKPKTVGPFVINLVYTDRAIGLLCCRGRVTQNRPEAMLIVSAIRVVLKKKAKMQCTVPVLRIRRLVKLTSAVCPDVPMTLAK